MVDLANSMLEPEPDPPGMEDRSERVVARQRAAVMRPNEGGREIPTITDDAAGFSAHENLPFGHQYKDPAGNVRTKEFTHTMHHDSDYEKVPEGALYADLEDNVRRKPKYHGIGYTAQTLYDMAHSDKGKRATLEKFYPGKVKEQDGNLYIEEEDGTLRKPGRGLEAATGGATAATAPMIGAVGGSLLGGAVGTLAEPGGGTVLGGAGGAYGGAYIGQGFNDIISNLAGVYDPEGAEANKRREGYFAAAGDVGGRALSAVAPTAKRGAKVVAEKSAKGLNYLLGTSKENLEALLPAAEKGSTAKPDLLSKLGFEQPGLEIPVKEIYQEAPNLKLLERLYREFHMQDTQRLSAERHVEAESKAILTQLGVPAEGSVLNPTAAVSSREAGESVLKAVGTIKQNIEKEFEEKLAARKQQLAAGVPETETQIKELQALAEGQHKAATMLVEGSIQDIQKTANKALTLVESGSNSGDATWAVATKIKAARDAAGAAFRQSEQEAYQAAPGSGMVEVSPLSVTAHDFLERLPEEFSGRFPQAVKSLRQIAGEKDAATGDWAFKPTTMHISELRELKRTFSESADWYNLPSGFRNGVLKQMTSVIDGFTKKLGTHPDWETSISLLKANDEWYSRVRPIFNSTEAQAVYKQLKAGAPVDSELLEKMVVRPGHTEITNKLHEVVGDNTWNLIKAGQVKRWTQTALKGQYDGTLNMEKFADEIIGANADGTLHAVQGSVEGDKLLKLARQIGVLKGKLDVNYAPGDTTFDIFRKAASAKQAAEEAAKKDPLKTLKMGVDQLEKDMLKEKAAGTRQRFGVLHFLNNMRLGEAEAADQILSKEDRVIASARLLGENSPAFKLLRQVWVKRFFEKNATSLSEGLQGVSEEVQKLMLPGMSREQTFKLAKEVKLAFAALENDTGSSMMAVNVVRNPLGAATGLGKLAGPAKLVPGANFGARAMLSASYKLVHRLITSPTTLRFLMKGFESPDPAEKAAARATLKAYLQRGGAIGAPAAVGLGESTDQGVQ